MRYTTSHLSGWLLSQNQNITRIGEDVERLKPLCHDGGVPLGQLLWKTVRWFLKILQIKLLCDLAIPFLGKDLK